MKIIDSKRRRLNPRIKDKKKEELRKNTARVRRDQKGERQKRPRISHPDEGKWKEYFYSALSGSRRHEVRS